MQHFQWHLTGFLVGKWFFVQEVALDAHARPIGHSDPGAANKRSIPSGTGDRLRLICPDHRAPTACEKEKIESNWINQMKRNPFSSAWNLAIKMNKFQEFHNFFKKRTHWNYFNSNEIISKLIGNELSWRESESASSAANLSTSLQRASWTHFPLPRHEPGGVQVSPPTDKDRISVQLKGADILHLLHLIWLRFLPSCGQPISFQRLVTAHRPSPTQRDRIKKP